MSNRFNMSASLSAVALVLAFAACATESHEAGEGAESNAASAPEAAAAVEPVTSGEAGEHAREGRGEHAEGDEHRAGGDEGDEESGEQIRPDAVRDAMRNGVRLVLSFDRAANAFVGRVDNTTAARRCAVRVEVHLSNGTELGTTERIDLAPGATAAVRLPSSAAEFESWTAHPEVSTCAGGASSPPSPLLPPTPDAGIRECSHPSP